MNQLLTRTWWKAAGIRAIKTFAQSATALISACAVVSEIDWLLVLYTSAISALLSLLTSLGGLPEVDDAPKCEVSDKKSNEEK